QYQRRAAHRLFASVFGVAYQRLQQVTETDLFYFIKLQNVVREESLVDCEVAEATIAGLVQQRPSAKEIFSTYGDSFISQIAYGIELTAVIHFHTKTQEQKRKLAHELNLEPPLQSQASASPQKAGV